MSFKAGKPGGQNAEKPIPFDDGLSVSHSPLDLGGGTSSSAQAKHRKICLCLL